MSLAEELLADLEEPEEEENDLQALIPQVDEAAAVKEDGNFP